MQGSQVNVKMSLKRRKKGTILNQGFHQRSKISALRHGKKNQCRDPTVAFTKIFGMSFEHNEVNVQHLMFLFH